MKVVMNNAEMVPTPKKGTIIRFGDFGLTVIGIYVGRSDDNGYMVGSSCTGRRLICYRWRCAYSNKGWQLAWK